MSETFGLRGCCKLFSWVLLAHFSCETVPLCQEQQVVLVYHRGLRLAAEWLFLQLSCYRSFSDFLSHKTIINSMVLPHELWEVQGWFLSRLPTIERPRRSRKQKEKVRQRFGRHFKTFRFSLVFKNEFGDQNGRGTSIQRTWFEPCRPMLLTASIALSWHKWLCMQHWLPGKDWDVWGALWGFGDSSAWGVGFFCIYCLLLVFEMKAGNGPWMTRLI